MPQNEEDPWPTPFPNGEARWVVFRKGRGHRNVSLEFSVYPDGRIRLHADGDGRVLPADLIRAVELVQRHRFIEVRQ